MKNMVPKQSVVVLIQEVNHHLINLTVLKIAKRIKKKKKGMKVTTLIHPLLNCMNKNTTFSSSSSSSETIKVFDGNYSLRRRIFRPVTVPRTCTVDQLLSASLRSLHITKDPNKFYVTDLYAPGGEEVRCQDPQPVLNLHRIEGKRPAIYLRFR